MILTIKSRKFEGGVKSYEFFKKKKNYELL